MQHPARNNTTYSKNRADGDSTNIYGNVYGNVNLPEKPREAGEQSPHQCLRDLRVTDPCEDRARIEGDKDRLLRDCYAWILDDASFQRWRMEDESRLLWIKGDPGKGKTMMTMGVIAELSRPESSYVVMRKKRRRINDPEPLLSFFFCQSTQSELNNALSVLRGLVYMLVTQREDLLRYVQKQYKAAGRQLFEGPNAVYAMKRILSEVLDDPSLPPTYLLVDALDECTSGLSKLLHIITDASFGQRSRVKWLVTSRNIPEIEGHLQLDSLGVKVSLEVKASHVSKAVAAFVEYKVQRLVTVQRYDARLQAEVQQQLRDKAEGTFLWVSLVCKELEKVPFYRTREVLQALPPGLDPLYERMMAQIVAQDAKTAGYCRDILQSITLAFRPLQLQELAVAAGLPKDQSSNVQAVADLVGRCGSFLTVREGVVSFIHLSAKDYFTLGNGRQVFDGPIKEEQGQMAHRLLDAMDSTLRRDICSLQKPGVRIEEAIGRVRGSCLLQVAYACEYWVEHVQAGGHDCSDILADGGKVHRFFQKHLLHWLEAMSLLQKVLEAELALQQVKAILDIPKSPLLSKVIKDALRFATWNASEILEAPLQVYYGALMSVPEQSVIWQLFKEERPEGWQVKFGLGRAWGPLLQTPEDQKGYVTSVVLSVAGDRLASASEDQTVRVWNTTTGRQLYTLKGHTDGVTSVTFSAAGDQLASASYDQTVQVWNTKTEQLLHKLKGHTRGVLSVAFSTVGYQLASSSLDGTVRVWDTKNGEPLHTLNGHTGWVSSVAFSAAGDRLASSSSDHTVRVWDAKTGHLLHTFGHTSYDNSLAFSSNGLYLETNRGSMLLPRSALSTSGLAPHSPAQRIVVLGRWVMADSEGFLHIPANYQPSCTAVRSHRVAFGCSSGRVLLLEIML